MRSRNIKPGFFKNELLCSLPPLNRLLFAGLWCLADRCGRIEERLGRIKAELLPYDECKGRGNVDQMLQRLHDAGFIRRYSVNGTKYIQIVNFAKHQHPHHLEAKSTIPALDKTGTEPGANPGLDQEITGQDGLIPDSLYTDSLNPDSRIPDSQHSGSSDAAGDDEWPARDFSEEEARLAERTNGYHRSPEQVRQATHKQRPPEEPPFDYYAEKAQRDKEYAEAMERREREAREQAEIKSQYAAKMAAKEEYRFPQEDYLAWQAEKIKAQA